VGNVAFPPLLVVLIPIISISVRFVNRLLHLFPVFDFDLNSISSNHLLLNSLPFPPHFCPFLTFCGIGESSVSFSSLLPPKRGPDARGCVSFFFPPPPLCMQHPIGDYGATRPAFFFFKPPARKHSLPFYTRVAVPALFVLSPL